eukprot:CAMPEP_0195298758 /NCGR_PEP_ID=MMETSP0707-20130614/24187_1 /TAXON_ID=33640 /ORGANISM="Asterionellopsis glacialis, Strain CCMP134" /LENGTH=367 /DNA_ID=CAMNT_0040360975 /DNA_START=73 /DNA_END=1176 /DNA_ORIENTATION=-
MALTAVTSISTAFQFKRPRSNLSCKNLEISIQKMTNGAVLAGIMSMGSLCLTGNSIPLVPVAFAMDKETPRLVAVKSTSLTMGSTAMEDDQNIVWNLGNGEVRLPNPLLLDNHNGLTLQNPRLLGSGGGGAVFAFQRRSAIVDSSSSSSKSSDATRASTTGNKERDVAVKVSWLRSTASVKKECLVLQTLEERHVASGVERCLYSGPYLNDARRQLIIMEPVVEDTVASIDQVPSPQNQAISVQCVMRTLIQMLAARVVTTDVQPLISRQTGEVLFIDMTEAEILPAPETNEPLSFINVALTSNFCVEMLALIPESFYTLASDTLIEELKALDDGLPLSSEMLDILSGQTIFTKEALDFIETKLNSV